MYHSVRLYQANMAELSIQKRRSGTISGAERITGVKNAQSEMLLSRRLTQYQLKYKKTKLVRVLGYSNFCVRTVEYSISEKSK